MVVKLCAFELDHVLWSSQLHAEFGKGSPDKLRLRFGMNHVVEDSSNPDNHIVLFPDITRIFYDMNKNNFEIAIVSNNGNKALCDRALYLFNAPDRNATMQPINPRFIKYDENSNESKSDMFQKIKEWSRFDYSEMVFFDLDSHDSRKVNKDHGVQLKVIDKQTGVTWKGYQDALQSVNHSSHGHNGGQSGRELAPYTAMPSLGDRLGAGKFAEAYRAKHDPESVIKKLKHWESGFQTRFVEIYKVIESGRPFEPENKPNKEDEQFLSMIAMEFRNVKFVGELQAPEVDRFCGWFQLKYIHGTPIWETPEYKHFVFTVPFQVYVRRAFHLVVDRLEWTVKQYGIEHRDPHLANVKFVVNEKACLLDWGFAVRMKWDGRHYVRGHDKLVWNSGEPGAKYTPEEFRRYWIDWMVKTKYEGQARKQAIGDADCQKYLSDIRWWYERD